MPLFEDLLVSRSCYVEVVGMDSWLAVWAKSDRNERNECVTWLPLHQHLADAAGVAGLLVDHWLSEQVIRRIGSELPDGDVQTLAVWLAGVHDVGKASPAFVVQVTELADYLGQYGLSVNVRLVDDPRRREVSHAIVGQLAVREWLAGELGFGEAASQLASIIGSHHGMPPERGQLAVAMDRADLTGAGGWVSVRNSILEHATDRAALGRYRDVELSRPVQVLLTAVVILADWIASNVDFFPLLPVATLRDAPPRPDGAATARRLAAGWAALNLPPRWVFPGPTGDLDQIFRDRFGRSEGAARPVQRAAVEVANAEPGMMIVEAPMGSGKTEAALLAAEVLASAGGADGCFVALPTQATTNAMFSRVRHWLDRLPRPEGASVSVSLAHGKAQLNDEYTGLVRKGRFVQVGDGDDTVVHHWLRGRKKAGLASFVVGTIDQVLFAGLKSRHLMLRHLALAGKVVIIDEVHAYDVYMSQYLYRVLHWLGAYRVPVVLLSATLPASRRAELLRAYDSGRGSAQPRPEHTGYPVITGSDGVAPRTLVLPPERSTVRVDRMDDGLDTLASYLRTNLTAGGCAVVVRNTVTRVQETAEFLSRVFGADRVTITHSRFLGCDRARLDRGLVDRFGAPDQNPARPALHIVVASQVVEQSLDIDFDLMVTDLAPVDLVLQRMGRLHRHDRDRPRPVTQPRCAIVGVVDWSGHPVSAVAGARRVYGDHLLLRAAAILVERDEIALPHDIAPLVRLAYGDQPVGPPAWQQALAVAARAAADDAQRRTAAARMFLLGEALTRGSLVGWLRAGVGDVNEDSAKGMAQVRDGEESLEVLVVQRDAGGGLVVPDWVEGGGGSIPLDQPVQWQQARIIAACSLRLPLALCHGGVIDAVIGELEVNTFSRFEHTPLLAGQLVLVLDEDRRADLHGYRLIYDLRRGLIHERT